MPPSRTSRFDPRPITNIAKCSSRQNRIKSANAFSLRGSTQTCEGRPTRNFGGMMSVIINEQKTIALILNLEPASCMLEFAKGSGNFFERNSKLCGDSDYTKGVVHVVFAGNIKSRFAEFFAAAGDAENRTEVPQIDIDATIVGLFGKSVGNRVFTFRTQTGSVGIINVVKDCPTCLIDHLRKDFFDRNQIGIKIKMLFLDIQNDSVLRVKAAEAAIALVTFSNEIFAAWIPVRVASKNRDFSANIVRRVEAALAHDVRCHC